MGAPGRTDCDRGEVQLSNGVGGDGGGDGGLLPVRVGAVYELPSQKETGSNHSQPEQFPQGVLTQGMRLETWLTFAVEVWERPWMVEDSRNSLKVFMALDPNSICPFT